MHRDAVPTRPQPGEVEAPRLVRLRRAAREPETRDLEVRGRVGDRLGVQGQAVHRRVVREHRAAREDALAPEHDVGQRDRADVGRPWWQARAAAALCRGEELPRPQVGQGDRPVPVLVAADVHVNPRLDVLRRDVRLGHGLARGVDDAARPRPRGRRRGRGGRRRRCRRLRLDGGPRGAALETRGAAVRGRRISLDGVGRRVLEQAGPEEEEDREGQQGQEDETRSSTPSRTRRRNAGHRMRTAQLQPLVAPQVLHFRQAPLRTIVKEPQSGHASPV